MMRRVLGIAIVLALMFAACGEGPIVEVEKIRTVQVQKVVTVEKVVEVPVQKIVTKEVIKIVVATPTPTQVPVSLWAYGVDTDPINQTDRHIALLTDDGAVELWVRCWLGRDDPFDVYIIWPDGEIEGGDSNRVSVEYRFVGDEPHSEFWYSSSRGNGVFAPNDIEVRFARKLLSSSRLHFRAQDHETGRLYGADLELDGQLGSDHPVRKVMQVCAITV